MCKMYWHRLSREKVVSAQSESWKGYKSFLSDWITYMLQILPWMLSCGCKSHKIFASSTHSNRHLIALKIGYFQMNADMLGKWSCNAIISLKLKLLGVRVPITKWSVFVLRGYNTICDPFWQKGTYIYIYIYIYSLSTFLTLRAHNFLSR